MVEMEGRKSGRPKAGVRAQVTRRTYAGRVAWPVVSPADQGKGGILQKAEDW